LCQVIHAFSNFLKPLDKELTRSLLKRAEQAVFSALIVTIDSTFLGGYASKTPTRRAIYDYKGQEMRIVTSLIRHGKGKSLARTSLTGPPKRFSA
jgi:hypothetical protein